MQLAVYTAYGTSLPHGKVVSEVYGKSIPE
jgi:hypothetical protein